MLVKTISDATEKLKKFFDLDVPVNLFDPVTELEHNTDGVFLPRRKEILINKNRCSSLEEYVPILIEELIHAKTGADDGSRAFQDFAIRKIAELINIKESNHEIQKKVQNVDEGQQSKGSC